MRDSSQQPKQEAQAINGQAISHYRVVRPLGAGGMGEVFLAEDTKLDRSVALKLLPKEVAADASRRKRFLAEAKSASSLNHSNVCTIYEVGETADGQPFIAMEYLEGQTLEALTRRRRLELREIVGIGVQVAEALEAARQHQVVHRDIKPGNIMMDAQRRVKVLDFGLAKRLDRPADASNVTQEGAIVGTPNYLSPELALGREVDSRTDIFSLGMVLYELAAGKNPFAGASFGETVNNILNRSPEPLKPWNPAVTTEFERIVRKCLEKDPTKRYGTPAQLRDDLARLQTHLQTPQSSSQKFWAAGAIVVALGVIGLGALWLTRSKPAVNPTAPMQQKSVAVLPFANMSADKADEYLSDGISEEIITALSKIKGLKVPARTSCFVFKGKNEDIRRIGQKLHVGTVLEGSITKTGNKVRVTAQLINIADGFHLWSETYDRALDDLLAIRTDVAMRVAEALKGQLLGEERQQLAKRGTENAEAYRLYLQGHYLWNRRTGEAIKQAIDHFNQAIAKDPGYALAHAGLSDCYSTLSEYGGLPIRETFPKARAAALKALELDSDLVEARTALAGIKADLDWDWAGAVEEYHRAIALNPNYATAHHWLSIPLRVLRRYDEALAEIKQAQELDPLSSIINANVGEMLWLNGRTDLGIEVLQKQITLDPSFAVTHNTLGWIYLEKDSLAEAIVEFETARRLAGQGGYGLDGLGCTYARAGRTNEAQKVLTQMLELQRQGFDQRVGIALVQRQLGDHEAALDSLETALEEHAFGLDAVNYHFSWKDLRPHPRVQAILRKMNLLPIPTTSAPTAVPTKSVAVLPFVNLSADGNDEYLSDGLSEDLSIALTPVKELRVPAWRSCLAFKGKTDDLRNIGRLLSVAAVLEGSVTKAGNKLRVNVRLSDVLNQTQLWATNYDREMTNILDIRSDIAQQVATALKIQLGVEETRSLGRKPTENLEAYKLYLRGRSLWNRRTGESVKQATEYFNQAIGKDPGYALAYAGLADCYVISPLFTDLPGGETFPKGRAAALKALELDSSLAEPRAALAFIKAHWDWDWSGAVEDFRRAIALNPNYATAHQWLAQIFTIQNLPAEALVEIQQAQDLDPLSPMINAILGICLFDNGKADSAIELLQKQIALDPSFVWGHYNLGGVYFGQGKYSEALIEFEASNRLEGKGRDGLIDYAGIYALAGRTNEARQMLDQLLQLQQQGKADKRLAIAAAQTALGDDEAALDWLEKALAEHSSGLEDLNNISFWKNLRKHPRFQAILRKMNLAPAPGANTPATAPPKSVAVLPFVNVSSDKENEYLSDGLTEEVLNSLARVKGLRVPARTSCFVFKGKADDVRKIGEQLSVATVLEGSVRKAGNQLRITAQLVSVADGFHLWSETYDRDMTNIFAIQSDIASRVAEALKGQLLGEDQRQLVTRTTQNMDAYRLYLRGRHLLSRSTDQTITEAIDCFEQAIAKDPVYALAHAGLADCYELQSYYAGLPLSQTYPKGRAAALRALELDSSLVEPRLVLAGFNTWMNWDFEGAEVEYRRAIALNPNSAAAYERLGAVLRNFRRYGEWATAARKAQELDPLSPSLNMSLGFALTYAGQVDLGTELVQRQAALDPSSVDAHNLLGWIYFDQRNYPEALAEFEIVRRLNGTGVHERASIGCAYARLGRTNEAQQILTELLELPRQGLNYHVSIGAVQHALGNDETALDSMEKALEEHSSGLNALNWGLFWSDLRPHPRAQAILRKMNLVK